MDDFDYDMMYDYDELSASYYDSPYNGGSNLWQEDEETGMNAVELWNLCLLPSVSDGVVHSANLLLWCLLFRLTTQIGKVLLIGITCFNYVILSLLHRMKSSY
jgi:hypothetical protein